MTSPNTEPVPPETEQPMPEEQPAPPPVEAETVHQEQPVDDEENPAEDEDEDEDDGDGRGVPAGGVLAGGATGLGVLGDVLWQVGGVAGLAASAVVAAGGVVAYTAYRVRRHRGRGRSAFTTRRTGSRTFHAGRAPKLGKGGGLLGGRAGRGGRGGGRGAGPLGKRRRGGGLGVGGGRAGRRGTGGPRLFTSKAAGRGGRSGGGPSRLGTIGHGGRRRAGRAFGRAGHAGLGLGRRGGGAARRGFGRWSTSTGGGAKVLARGLGKGARKAGALALKTEPGRRTAAGFKAAQAALRTGGKGTWRVARKSAGAALGKPKTQYTAWATSMGGAVLMLAALLHGRWKARKAKKAARRGKTTTTTTTTTTTSSTDGGPTTTHTSTTTKTTSTTPGQALVPFASPRATGAGPAGRTSSRTTSGRSRAMEGGFPLAVAAAEVHTVAAAYEPPDMWTVENDLQQVPNVIASVAMALRTYTQKLEGRAVEHPVREQLQAIYTGLSQVAQHSQELHPLFRQLHEHDLRRKEAPRGDESDWNL